MNLNLPPHAVVRAEEDVIDVRGHGGIVPCTFAEARTLRDQLTGLLATFGDTTEPEVTQSATSDIPPGECTETAERHIEAYSPAHGLAHGSLDQSRYACAAHVEAAVAAIEAAGMTAYRGNAQLVHPHRCGEVFDYTTLPESVRQFRTEQEELYRRDAESGGESA